KGKTKEVARDLYTIRSNEVLKMLGDYLASKLPTVGVHVKQSDVPRTYALNLLDARTVIIAAQAGLGRFLRGNARPNFMTSYAPMDQSNGTNPGGGMIGSPINPPMGMMGMTGAPLAPPIGV